MERSARWPRRRDALADQPVGLGGVLAQQALLHEGADDVRHRLVQRARTGGSRRRPGGDAAGVGQLVTHHVERRGEPVEDHAVPVTEDQLVAVPERVVVVLSVVNGGDRGGAGAVVGAAAPVVEQGLRGLEPDRGLVHGDVPAGGVAGAAQQLAGQCPRCPRRSGPAAPERPRRGAPPGAPPCPPRRAARAARCRCAASARPVSTRTGSSDSARWRTRWGGTNEQRAGSGGRARRARWRSSSDSPPDPRHFTTPGPDHETRWLSAGRRRPPTGAGSRRSAGADRRLEGRGVVLARVLHGARTPCAGRGR